MTPAPGKYLGRNMCRYPPCRWPFDLVWRYALTIWLKTGHTIWTLITPRWQHTWQCTLCTQFNVVDWKHGCAFIAPSSSRFRPAPLDCIPFLNLATLVFWFCLPSSNTQSTRFQHVKHIVESGRCGWYHFRDTQHNPSMPRPRAHGGKIQQAPPTPWYVIGLLQLAIAFFFNLVASYVHYLKIQNFIRFH